MNPLYEQMKTSVFERMSGLAAQHGAVNLGQGFPDFGWPPEILEAAAKAVVDGSNQYAPSRGTIPLREAVAAHYNRQFGQQLSTSEVCVTSGATEALGSAILAAVQPGDEVIIFTPAYDSYAPMIHRAGAKPVEIALRRTSDLTARLMLASPVLVPDDEQAPEKAQFERIIGGLAKQLRSSLERKLGRYSVDLPVFPPV